MDQSQNGEEETETATGEAAIPGARKTRSTAITSARTLLAQQKLLDEERTDLASLGIALKKIATQLYKTKTTHKTGDTIRAIATLIEDTAVDALAQRVAQAVKDGLTG